MTLCDIIIPVHDNLSDTRACLEWLARHTQVSHRLILVDDASGAETRLWLEAAARNRGQGTALLLRNETTQGWTGATNRGLAASRAPFVCLLNNDTLPAAGWLARLLAHFQRNPRLGLLQPAGNDRSLRKLADRDIPAHAARLARQRDGVWTRLGHASGFCLALPRALLERLGPFDPAYALGLFADLDYCRRAQDLGWLAGQAEDALVLHLVNRTLDRVNPAWRETAREAERLFISRWGYKQRVFWAPPAPLRPERLQTRVEIEALYRLADRGHVFHAPLPAGLDAQDLLAALRLPLHANVFFMKPPGVPGISGPWRWWRQVYLRRKRQVERVWRGTLADLDLTGLPFEKIPPDQIGRRYRGK